jgi:hypothetical protein
MVCFVNMQRVLRAIEAPAEMRAEFKLYLEGLRFVVILSYPSLLKAEISLPARLISRKNPTRAGTI